MANRRMFSRAVTSSGRFLRLSPQARALYFDLGMEADDDGFAEGFGRLAATGAKEEHLFELEQRGFLTIPDRENLVVHITDWEANNLIRRDRYTPSVYRSIYPQCVGAENEPQQAEVSAEAEIQEAPIPQTEPEPIPEAPEQETGAETTLNPDGCLLVNQRLTQVRLGKDRLGKVSIGQDRLPTEDARARGEKSPPEPAERPGENQIDFLKKKQNSMDYLLNSEYFAVSRASPVIHASV